MTTVRRLHPDEQAAGRPVDFLRLRDGAVLVSDDQEGRIYRITCTEPVAGIDRRDAP